MTGLKETMNKDAILTAIKKMPENKYFVWDGVCEDDRPLSKSEMQASIKNRK